MNYTKVCYEKHTKVFVSWVDCHFREWLCCVTTVSKLGMSVCQYDNSVSCHISRSANSCGDVRALFLSEKCSVNAGECVCPSRLLLRGLLLLFHCECMRLSGKIVPALGMLLVFVFYGGCCTWKMPAEWEAAFIGICCCFCQCCIDPEAQ